MAQNLTVGCFSVLITLGLFSMCPFAPLGLEVVHASRNATIITLLPLPFYLPLQSLRGWFLETFQVW